MKKQYIELENSFDVSNTSFSLRGNSSVFQHLYEYTKTFKVTPKHHINFKFGRTSGETVRSEFMAEMKKAFPDAEMLSRNMFDLDLYEVPKNLNKFIMKSELITFSGTTISMYSTMNGQSNYGAEIFVGTDEEYEIIQSLVKNAALAYRKVDDEFKDKFYMITHDGQSLDLLEYTINKSKFDNFDIELLYNDDFKDASDKIKQELEKKDGSTGIVLLHGIYGSGKTTYLRHLISSIQKRIIYLPPDMASQLGQPAFFNFIRGYPESILIIEDAETILKKRIEGGSAAIANILNLSDGIMGDALGIQVVCTFNAEIDEIDEALLRPGRLIANYYFDYLSKDKTLALVKKVHGKDAVPDKPEMTVAEIYKMNEKYVNNDKPKSKNKRGIGFLVER